MTVVLREPPARKRRGIIRRLFRFLLFAGVILGLLALVWMRHAIYNRFVRFPREEAAWQAVRQQRQPVSETAGWNEYRGILHSHSHFSHDSTMSFPGILHAMEIAQLDFICLSDHCIESRADFDWQWRGLHEGRLFVPGFEMKEGIMPFGVASGVVLSNTTDSATLARQIIDNGGVLFYAHPEEPRDWDRPELTGMEIYNLHTDFKEGAHAPLALLPDIIWSQRRYPEHLYRVMFRRPTEFLHHWDELNRTRHITGIAGNDCHQNVGLRASYTTNNTLRLDDTSPKPIREFALTGFVGFMARTFFAPIEPGREIFHLQLDPYERSAHYVNTHLLAHELSESAVLDSLRAGRVYVGFDLLADCSGFRWFARDSAGIAVMGESKSLSPDTRLVARAPLSCRFTVVKDGAVVHQAEGRSLEYAPTGSGKYRVEAELSLLNEWVPWIYANPIELK